MQNTTGNNLRLGILVTLSVTLFLVGIYFIGKRKQLFNNTFRVNAIFKDINGLLVGNNVRFSGINIGIVDDIQQITDSTVNVSMEINEQTRKFINKNSKATIGSDGLMGNKIILILPGNIKAQELSDNDILPTVKQITMDDILMKIKITSENAASITGNLASIIENIRAGKGTVGKLFMDTTFANNLDKTLINIKQGAGGFKQNMDAASHNVLLRNFFKKKKK